MRGSEASTLRRLESCARGGGAKVRLGVVVVSDFVIAVGQHFLHVAQILFGLGDQRALRVRQQERLESIFRRFALGFVAVGFFHHFIVRQADLHLGVGCFVEKRKESAEVVIFLDGLREVGSAAFLVVGVGDGEFGFGEVFAVWICVDQGLQRQASFGVAASLQIRLGAIVENFVRFG